MLHHMIKICGIRNAETAQQAVALGVDFIGLVFHPASHRHVSIEEGTLISRATKKAGGLPVAVFVDQTAREMQAICDATDIQIVQLHGNMARRTHHLLPESYQKIYGLPVSDKAGFLEDHGLQYLNPEQDLVLVDHQYPGKGKIFPHTGFHYQLPFPWLLAGGLTPDNVAISVDSLQPDGIDISTGVENANKQKDILLIQQVVTNMRGHNAIRK